MTTDSKLDLQRAAMQHYHPDDYPPETLDHDSVEEDGALDGDTLALFIWREVGGADDRAHAIRMLRNAAAELAGIAMALETPITMPQIADKEEKEKPMVKCILCHGKGWRHIRSLKTGGALEMVECCDRHGTGKREAQ